MPDKSFLTWPFFADMHRDYAAKIDAWAQANLQSVDHHDVDAACRKLVKALGQGGFLMHTAPASESDKLDVRTLALSRETLARHSGLADFAFAMQGLGAGPISLFGTSGQRVAWLPKTRAGEAIAAFALSEAASGSDVANITTSAKRDGDTWVIDGEKTWIEWSPEVLLPAVFIIDDHGRESLANGNMRGPYYVIDSVHDRLLFRIDRETARATRHVPKAPAK